MVLHAHGKKVARYRLWKVDPPFIVSPLDRTLCDGTVIGDENAFRIADARRGILTVGKLFPHTFSFDHFHGLRAKIAVDGRQELFKFLALLRLERSARFPLHATPPQTR